MPLNNALQIIIPTRGDLCAKGEELFIPGMEYYSVLCKGDEKGITRQDFCLNCWELFARHDFTKSSQTYWKSKVPPKKKAPAAPLHRNEKALELLKASVACDQMEDQAEAFVLAVYLARKKLLYLRDEVLDESGKRIQFYEVAATEEMIGVPKIDLSAIPIDKIQSNLAKKLNT